MAIAFYIPDQASLLRKANEQELQILRMREEHWKFIATVVLNALRHYVSSESKKTTGYTCCGRKGLKCSSKKKTARH